MSPRKELSYKMLQIDPYLGFIFMIKMCRSKFNIYVNDELLSFRRDRLRSYSD